MTGRRASVGALSIMQRAWIAAGIVSFVLLFVVPCLFLSGIVTAYRTIKGRITSQMVKQ